MERQLSSSIDFNELYLLYIESFATTRETTMQTIEHQTESFNCATSLNDRLNAFEERLANQ